MTRPEVAGALSLFDLVAPPAPRQIQDLLDRRSERQEVLSAVTLLACGRPSLIADLLFIRLPDGCVHILIKDVSQQHRLESHVQRLVTAIDATPDIFFLTDADFRITFVNPAFQTSTGYSIEHALGLPADFFRASSESAKIREYKSSVLKGTDWTGEITNLRCNGSVFVVEATVSPIYDRAGKFLGLASCERDISQRKRLEQELLHEHNFALSILQSVDAAVYALDRNFQITHFNDGWRKLPSEHGGLVISQPPLKGQSLLDYVPHPGKRAELRALLELALHAGQLYEREITGSETAHHWLVRISPWNHLGEHIGLIYEVCDQTRLHLLQDQLVQSQKMELVGKLAAGIAHDFNNLLTAMRGNALLAMMDRNLSEPVREQLQQIDAAAVRATEVTRHLSTFSRASDERVEVLDFNQVITDAGQFAGRSLGRNVEFVLHPAPQPIKVRMDATRAKQLLLNLCVNAGEAMSSSGKLTLTNAPAALSAEQARKASCPEGTFFMRCSVGDTGKGIPSEILPRIFEPFFTTKSKGAGTGLGLAIVQQVVQRAGGFIEVETCLGSGTTFHIFLPLAEGGTRAPAPSGAPYLHTGSGSILVVEDGDLVRQFTQSFLKTAGYEVLVAVDAEEALKQLESRPVDLLLTDYDMPGMNGLELIKQVAGRWPAMKLVLASGYLEVDDQEQLNGELNCRVLNKPYNVREATGLIAELLSNRN